MFQQLLLRSRSSLINKVVKVSSCKDRSLLFPISLLKNHPSCNFSTEVELTSVRYATHVQRHNFNQLNSDDISYFKSILDDKRVVTEASDIAPHNTDWLKMVRGYSSLLLKPKTSEEVSDILRYCNSRKLGVCPQGGNTGLVGGSVPVFDEIIISTSLMNKIISLNQWSNVLTCEAGCVLETLNDFLVERDLIMPLDLGAKGSCHIGGNAATNAGGLRLLRYGSLHSTILGIEAVLADGTILDCMSGMRKDNTGYDLKHLFIGSEGTLGFITKVAIHCPPKPKSVNLALLGLSDYSSVLQVVKLARNHLSEILSSLEYIDSLAMSCVVNNLRLSAPLSKFPFYVLIETSGSDESHDAEKLNRFLTKVLEEKIVADGVVASDSKQMLVMLKILKQDYDYVEIKIRDTSDVPMRNIWGLRERIAEALLHDGYVYKYDLSIPLTHFDKLVTDMREHLGNLATRVCGYGHLGDGNIHLNLSVSEYDDKITSKIEPFIFQWVSDNKGSVSAEHGLGFKKREFITYTKSQGAVDMMRRIKNIYDPNGILNPYKVLPD